MVSELSDRAGAILDAAEAAIQHVGYNGLSFRDLATEVGIKSASVHYHYPTKAALGVAVTRRYTARLGDRLVEIAARQASPERQLGDYAALFRLTLQGEGRMCLGGMLAAEADAVPPEVREEIGRFIDANVRWVADVIAPLMAAPPSGEVTRARAAAIFAMLEGAMLVARGSGDRTRFDAIEGQVVAMASR